MAFEQGLSLVCFLDMDQGEYDGTQSMGSILSVCITDFKNIIEIRLLPPVDSTLRREN